MANVRTAAQLLEAWEKVKHCAPPELAVIDPTYIVEVVMRLRQLHQASAGVPK